MHYLVIIQQEKISKVISGNIINKEFERDTKYTIRTFLSAFYLYIALLLSTYE